MYDIPTPIRNALLKNLARLIQDIDAAAIDSIIAPVGLPLADAYSCAARAISADEDSPDHTANMKNLLDAAAELLAEVNQRHEQE